MTAALAGLLKMMLALLACADDGIVCHHPMMVLHPRSLTHNDDMMPLSTEASAASPAVESPTPSSAAASQSYAGPPAGGTQGTHINAPEWGNVKTRKHATGRPAPEHPKRSRTYADALARPPMRPYEP